ncbi:MAG: ABC transporter permease, partial [Mesorhizobium sp.]
MSAATKSERALPWALVTPALGWTLLFFVLPFVAMAVSSLTAHEAGGFTLSNYSQFFANPSYWQAMVNSLQVTAIVTVISVLLAYPFAWILAEQVPERWQRLALMLAVLPFWTSYVVRSYSWLLVLAQNGVVNRALTGSGVFGEPLQLANTRLATVTGFVHFFVMLLTLTIFANLKQLSPSYRKAAADLGAGPVRTFLHVVLPLTLPGIMVGAFLTFVLCIGDYITPQIL